VKNDARGFSVTGNVGYRIPFAGNWFVEQPSAGAVWSRVEVDPVKLIDIIRVDDITSVLGRASLRVGANFTEGIYTWQPFVTATVVHEFAGKAHSTAEHDHGVIDPQNLNGIMFNTTTTRMGTYAQIGLGSAIVVGNTGWLGYGRGDVKFGDNVEGFGVNFGLRYQW
jgi:outer membrane autotransporter protein